MAAKHLAIFLKGTAEKILDREREVELRLSQAKVLPYGAVKKDDEIFLKDAGGKIIGKVLIDNVLYYDNLTSEMLANIRREYARSLKLDDDFWDKKRRARYATIIFLKKPVKFLTPIPYRKPDRRPWVVMEE